MPITLTTRAGKGSALSAAEHDTNLGDIETLVNSLETNKADQTAVDTAIATRSPKAKSGAGAPTGSADEVGQWYVNTSNGDLYQASDTGGGAGDWDLVGSLTLAANQYAAQNTGNTALEARTDKREFPIGAAAPNGEFLAATGSVTMIGPDYAWTLTSVKLLGVGDEADVQVFEAGSGINGFSSAVTITTAGTVQSVASTEAIAANAVLRVDWTNGGASLTGVVAKLVGTRTAD